MKKGKKNNKGFTLVELIIVVAIIALLIAMIAPNLTSFLGTASKTTLQANAKTAYTAANAWMTQRRVEGKVVPEFNRGNDLILTKDGDHIKVSSNTYTIVEEDYADLVKLFNAAEFTDNTKVYVMTEGWNILKIWWWEGSEGVSYPQ